MSNPPPNAPRDDVYDPAADGWTPLPDQGFIQLVGPVWTRRHADGQRRYGFLPEPRHANLVGLVQGGMVMTFADRGLGLLAWEAAGGPAVTLSYEHHFVGPGRIGSFLELSGEVVRKTTGIVFMRGLVTDGSQVVASCQGTWKILSKRRAHAPVGLD
ncbi:acyl-coenzyme A thioesterase PaaI-like protein [Enterovirga rhinocerotis]|uniref:Acyl-coenzyme A thioesterase PaaI-like protein n=1 Tax=Enterovirga rhinocerotis TaxID=1339210 RepID=A0A4V3DX32_9HYPH|nr:acyl-coenzyme A thioesterase PaaI-like protein [Enterovirga rhinocerotis]